MKCIFLVNFFILLMFNFEETTGGGILTVYYISFDTKGKSSSLGNCDYGSECDPLFKICLRYGHSDVEKFDCGSITVENPKITSFEYTNTDYVVFNDFIGGTRNPVMYETNDRFQKCKFEISIVVIDVDPPLFKPDDDIDTVIIRLVSKKTDFSDEIIFYSRLSTDYETITKLSYKLKCDDNYYLPCCIIYCKAQNNIKGHYECDPETGAKICFSDYVGIDCNIKKCPTGYEWNDVTNSCVDIDECLTPTPCQQICTNTEGSYFCSCEEGFYLYSFTDCSLILLAGTTLSSTSVGLNWQTAHKFSLYYSVYYREVTYYIQVTDISYFYSSTNGLEIIVIGLLPYRSYEFYVIATWTNGTNGTVDSNNVTMRTNQDTPSLPPTNIIGVSKNATKITIYWSAISQGSLNGIIVGYTILINRTSNSGQGLDTTEHLRDASSVSYKITDLTTHTDYLISVAAATSVGKGPYSAAISVRISGSASTQYFFIDPCNKTNLLYGGKFQKYSSFLKISKYTQLFTDTQI